jgi:hypothetical protein
MGWYRNDVGPRLIDKIENERRQKKLLGIDPARQSARQAALSLAKGSTHIRSHVDVDHAVGSPASMAWRRRASASATPATSRSSPSRRAGSSSTRARAS